MTVFVNGAPAAGQQRGAVFFRPAGPGFARVTVIDGTGATDSVVVRFDDGVAAITPAAVHAGSRP